MGKTLSDREWIGMCRREILDDFMRKRAKSLGAKLVNGLFMGYDYDQPDGEKGSFVGEAAHAGASDAAQCL